MIHCYKNRTSGGWYKDFQDQHDKNFDRKICCPCQNLSIKICTRTMQLYVTFMKFHSNQSKTTHQINLLFIMKCDNTVINLCGYVNVIVLYANLIVVHGNLSIMLSVHKSTKIACVLYIMTVLQSDR